MQITQAAKTKQHSADNQQVNGDNPLNGSHAAAEGVIYHGQNRVDDAAIQGRHEGANTNRQQHPPFAGPFGVLRSQFSGCHLRR